MTVWPGQLVLSPGFPFAFPFHSDPQKHVKVQSPGSSLPLILKRDISFEFSPDSPSVSSDPRKLSEPPPLDPFVQNRRTSWPSHAKSGVWADSAGFSHVNANSANLANGILWPDYDEVDGQYAAK